MLTRKEKKKKEEKRKEEISDVVLELEPRVKVFEVHHQGDQLEIVRKTPWANKILSNLSLNHLAREIPKLVVHRVIDWTRLPTFVPVSKNRVVKNI